MAAYPFCTMLSFTEFVIAGGRPHWPITEAVMEPFGIQVVYQKCPVCIFVFLAHIIDYCEW